MASNPFSSMFTGLGGKAASAGSKAWTGVKAAGKEGARAALYSAVLGGGGNENQSLSQRVGGAIGESFKEATFNKMGTLGKAIANGSSKSKAGKSPTGGGGVQGESVGYQNVKTDNVITAINQSSRQIVGALNTLNATQRMGFNAQTNQIQAQAQSIESLSGYGEDTVLVLREIYDLLNKQDYESNSKGNASSIPNFTGGAITPAAANDNSGGGGILGGALAAGAATIGGGLISKGAEKLLGKSGEKTLAKSILKKLPGLGILAGLAFGAYRLAEGDILGAAGEVVSGALGSIPVVGTAASLAADAGLAAYDMGAFGDASQANAEPVTNTDNSELSPQEINQVFQSVPVGTSDADLLATAKKMFPGRKYGTLKARMKQMHDLLGASSPTSNVQLASNEILPGMLGSGDYLSQRQQELDASRQGGDSGIPTLSGTFGPNTSENALRQQEANLENSSRDNPNKIEITARDIVYKADTLTFDVNTIKFIQGSTGGASPGSAPPGDGGGGGNQDETSPVSAPSATPGGGSSNWGAVGGTESRDGSGVLPQQSGGAAGEQAPPGKFRPVYKGINADLQDQDLINIIGNEARQSNESIDAVINNMMNRLGSPSYGNAKSLSDVAKQKNQYESWDFLQSGRFKPVSKERAEKIRERLRLIASGSVPDSTGGANEFRASSYVFGEGRGKTFARKAAAQGNKNLGGNVYANTGFQAGPYAAYESTGQSPPEQSGAAGASPVSNEPATPSLSVGDSGGQASAPQSSPPPALSSGTPSSQSNTSTKSGGRPAGLSFASHVNKNINTGIAGKIKEIQGAFGQTLNITSGYRDPSHNKKVGGAKNSAHMRKNAVDVKFNGGIPETLKLIKTASQMGIGGIGVYSPGKVHLDTENRRAWGPSYGRSSVPSWAEEAIRAHESGQMGAYDPSAAGSSGQDATMETSGSGGSGGAGMSPVSSSGGAEGAGGSAGGNLLSAMLGGGGSPFGAVGSMLGSVVGSMSKSTSLASAAPAKPSTGLTNVNVASRLPDTSRREMPSSRNPAPGLDEIHSELIKLAFG